MGLHRSKRPWVLSVNGGPPQTDIDAMVDYVNGVEAERDRLRGALEQIAALPERELAKRSPLDLRAMAEAALR